jgi:hypothetical protein
MHLLTELFVLLAFIFWVLYIFWVSVPISWITGKDFSPVGLSLHFGNYFLCYAKTLFNAIPFVNSCSYFLEHLESHSERCFLCLFLEVFLYIFFTSSFKVLGHTLILSILSWFLYRMTFKDLISVFYMWKSGF